MSLVHQDNKQKIIIQVDETCKMVCVSLNETVIMEGNYWDFKNGTHNINEYGVFNSYIELSTRLYQYLLKQGVKYNEVDTLQIKYRYIKEKHNKEWFINKIGKRIFRNENDCNCNSCLNVFKKGLIVNDHTHANYLYDVQNEMNIHYFD